MPSWSDALEGFARGWPEVKTRMTGLGRANEAYRQYRPDPAILNENLASRRHTHACDPTAGFAPPAPFAIAANHTARSIAARPRQRILIGHFARGLTVEEALPVIRQALQDWAGGEREDVLPGDLSLDQFRDAVIADKYYREQWGVQGKDAGVVTLNFSGHEPRNAGLKRRCTLTFHP